MGDTENPAEIASKKALEEVYACLDANRSFRLEAGAGAGKTYSLVKALEFLVERCQLTFPKQNQKIACITFTNVAKDQIIDRVDGNPLILCDTNHAFCWSLIRGFQRQLREFVDEIPKWNELLEDVGGIGSRLVEYKLGFRTVSDDRITLHHDDILPLTIRLMENEKFRRLVSSLFPIILIDEYQDTDADWVEAMKTHFLGQEGAPLFGFFGDHWQKIYDEGCGALEHGAVQEIGKEANFRSVQAVVDVLNRMRPELPQFVVDSEAPGEIKVFHSNDWVGERQKGNHWKGDLPTKIGHEALEQVKATLIQAGWDLSSESTKILMLTHRVLADEQGYSSLRDVFRYNDAFTRKEHPYIAYFVDVLEPACGAYSDNRYGLMFKCLGGGRPLLRSASEKADWATSMDKLIRLRQTGSVGDVLDHLLATKKPRLPDKLADRERELRDFDRGGDEAMSSSLAEIAKLREVRYAEIQALAEYHTGHSPFETKHGVKGAQFENVLVIVGRGWNKYDFGEMLEFFSSGNVPAAKQEAFIRNRNLFYVACSRPKRRLAVLFTQELTRPALQTLGDWFGEDSVTALAL